MQFDTTCPRCGLKERITTTTRVAGVTVTCPDCGERHRYRANRPTRQERQIMPANLPFPTQSQGATS